jgi:hypothetical protein
MYELRERKLWPIYYGATCQMKLKSPMLLIYASIFRSPKMPKSCQRDVLDLP